MKAPPTSLARWITVPSTLAVVAGAGVTALAFALTTQLPNEGTGVFWGVVTAVVAALLLAGDVIEQATLKPLRALEGGAGSPADGLLIEAARVAARSPDIAFLLTATMMPVGAVLIAAAWSVLAVPPSETVVRLLLTGFVMTPLTAVLAHVTVLPRSREVLRQLVSRGLPVLKAYKAGPGRFELRRRLLLFTAVAVTTPMVLVIDMTLRRFDALTRVGAGDDGGAGTSMWQLAVLLFLVVALVTMCARLIGTALGEPLRALAVATEGLAQGQTHALSLVAAEHELWAAAGAMASMETHVRSALEKLHQTADDTAEVTTRLLAEGEQQRRWTNEQAATLTETSGTTGQLAHSAGHIASQAEKLAMLAQQTLAAARDGQASAQAFTQAMNVLRGGNHAVADEVVRLNGRLQHVGKVVDFINGVADQADVLALNAELEGYKAGEVGAGFSQVAAEMRRLAESVTQATVDIDTLIDDVRGAANAAVMATEAGVKATDAGSAVAADVRVSLQHIVEYAVEASAACDAISAATDQQRVGTETLASSLGSVVDSTQRGAAMSRDLVALTHALQAVVSELRARVAGARGPT